VGTTEIMTFLHASPFYELAALLALAAIAGMIGFFLRQPMIVSYIAVGILAGPSAFGIVKSYQSIEQLAELSIAVLLFLVGMKLDLNKIKKLGPISVLTGLGQIIFTSLFGFLITLSFGFDALSSLYISAALTFSSTIIIVKLLSDKKEVDALHGRIAIGFLIVQDICVVLLLMVLSNLGSEIKPVPTVGEITAKIGYLVALFVILVTFLILFIRYVATPLISQLIRSTELLITFAISWAAFFAAVGSFFGFSKELGGLLAGISFASTPFRETVVTRLSPLRDFLLLFFFISLGSKIDMTQIGLQILPATVLSVFVLIGNPLIVMAIMGYMGYQKRTGFLAGLTVAQISEFSLVLIAMGLSLGHVSADSVSLVTLVGLITISVSIYLILYSHELYFWLEPLFRIFERKRPFMEEETNPEKMITNRYDVIMYGLGRYGMAIGLNLKKSGFTLLGVDYDPEALQRWRKRGLDSIYGDAWDFELLAKPPIKETRWLICAIPQSEFGIAQEDPREALIESLQKENYRGKIAVTAQHPKDAAILRKKGADIVFLPFFDAAERAVEKIKEAEEENF